MAIANSGVFIVFEGIDGTGKTTLSQMLATYLRSLGYSVLLTREPRTDNPFGQKIRDASHGRIPSLTPQEEVELFIKDRKIHLETIVLPALKEGKIVISDRYFYSNVAYQGSRGLNWKQILKRNLDFALLPDLVLLLDCPASETLERKQKENRSLDQFEDLTFLERVRAIYLRLWRQYSSFFVKIDASDTLENVWRQVLAAVTPVLDSRPRKII